MKSTEDLVFTWAHRDETVILAAGNSIAVGRVVQGVPALSELISYQLWLSHGRTARFAKRFKLPEQPTALIKQFDRHVIRVSVLVFLHLEYHNNDNHVYDNCLVITINFLVSCSVL